MDFKLQKNKSLKNFTTLKIGGEADYLAEVANEKELRAALQFAEANTTAPPLILGGGSNVLGSDEGYRGLVIINKIKGYEVIAKTADSVSLAVGAGEVFDEIIEHTIRDGYWGLENLSAIPGSVGATPIQNVGAYGVEVSTMIDSVSATHINTLEQKSFTPAECQFAYRDSYFKSPVGRQWCVTSVVYQLSKLPKPILNYQDVSPLSEIVNLTQTKIRDHIIKVRAEKFPDWREVGTAGSFFKNPIITSEAYETIKQEYPAIPSFPSDAGRVKVPLGWILDKVCHLRGYKKGNVGLFEKQALVLVTAPEATAGEVEEFVSYVAGVVKDKTGITIEREVLSV